MNKEIILLPADMNGNGMSGNGMTGNGFSGNGMSGNGAEYSDAIVLSDVEFEELTKDFV